MKRKMQANQEANVEENERVKMFLPPDIEEVISELGETHEEGEVIGNLLMKSIQVFFEVGFKLAEDLNLELAVDSFKKAQDDINKK